MNVYFQNSKKKNCFPKIKQTGRPKEEKHGFKKDKATVDMSKYTYIKAAKNWFFPDNRLTWILKILRSILPDNRTTSASATRRFTTSAAQWRTSAAPLPSLWRSCAYTSILDSFSFFGRERWVTPKFDGLLLSVSDWTEIGWWMLSIDMSIKLIVGRLKVWLVE